MFNFDGNNNPSNMTSKKLSINQWADEDKPREKLILKGNQALTNAELIAILLGSGSSSESVVDLSRRVVQTYNNDLTQLFGATIADLQKFKGIGQAKALIIMAAIELARRYQASKEGKAPEQILNADDAYKAIAPVLYGLKHEEFWILSLSAASKLISKYKISQGGITSTNVDMRIVFQRVFADNATSIILCHNHPSGSMSISEQDKRLTKRIGEASNMLDIKLLDHIIVVGDTYVSFADEGLL